MNYTYHCIILGLHENYLGMTRRQDHRVALLLSTKIAQFLLILNNIHIMAMVSLTTENRQLYDTTN